MNKTVMVTGARRGLGLAICRRLAAERYRVIAVGRSPSEQLDALCASADTEVHFEAFDLQQTAKMHEWVAKLGKKYGRFYGLVNNAAIGADGILGTMHERDINEALLVNLQSPIVLTKYISRSMLLGGGGRIVNVSSIIASTGYSGLSVYAASKAGLIGFTRSLARELGKAGINVNAVAPGYMETNMTAGLQGEKLESIRRRSPSGKLPTVDAVAGSVAFLLGRDADMISGAVLTVDNGSTA
jgi:3-oxoacyl-[acyl-carrier protein] reductase